MKLYGISGTSIAAEDDDNPQPGQDEVMIYLNTNGLGTIGLKVGGEDVDEVESGAFKVRKGSVVELTAKPALVPGGDPIGFDGWFNNGEQTPFSMQKTLQFTITSMRDIIARWHPWGGLE